MTIAVYADSFDPFTIGHLDIALKAVQCFDLVIITPGVLGFKLAVPA